MHLFSGETERKHEGLFGESIGMHEYTTETSVEITYLQAEIKSVQKLSLCQLKPNGHFQK